VASNADALFFLIALSSCVSEQPQFRALPLLPGKTWCKTILVVYGLTPRGPLAEFSFTREFSRVTTTINDVPARTARIIL